MIRNKPKPLTADFSRFVDGASIGGAKNAMPEYERLQQLCLGIAQHANWQGNEPLGHVRLVLDRALSSALLASLSDKMADKLVSYIMPAAVAGVLATKEDATSEGVAKEIDWPALIKRVFTEKRYSVFSRSHEVGCFPWDRGGVDCSEFSFNPDELRDNHGMWTAGGGGEGKIKEVAAKLSPALAPHEAKTYKPGTLSHDQEVAREHIKEAAAKEGFVYRGTDKAETGSAYVYFSHSDLPKYPDGSDEKIKVRLADHGANLKRDSGNDVHVDLDPRTSTQDRAGEIVRAVPQMKSLIEHINNRAAASAASMQKEREKFASNFHDGARMGPGHKAYLDANGPVKFAERYEKVDAPGGPRNGQIWKRKSKTAASRGGLSSSAFAKFDPTTEGAPEEQVAVANEWTLIRPTVALDWWTARLAIPPGLLTAKSRSDFAFSPARRRALRIAHVEQQAVIDAAARGIQESLASTKEHPYGSRQFKQAMAESFDEVGMDPLKPWHVQLVYDQEMSNSYGAARTRTQEDKEVKKLLPYGIIHTIGDGRVRPMPGQEAQVMKTGDNHRVMDNLCMPLDDARWHGRIPPLYFRCRCVRAVVRKKPSGAKTEPSSEFVPKSGWGDGGMNAWDESEAA